MYGAVEFSVRSIEGRDGNEIITAKALLIDFDWSPSPGQAKTNI